jgi:hypothetical protein
MYVLERDSEIVGFYSLIRLDSLEIELDDFFVAAPWIGSGFGKLLWSDATRRSIDLRHQQLRIVADPNAEGFYIKRGATRVGQKISRMDPNRIPPVLVYDLSKYVDCLEDRPEQIIREVVGPEDSHLI